MHRYRLFIPIVVLLAAACDDPFGPNVWDATPDTIVLYSASRAEYTGYSSVVDITSLPVAALPLESPGLTGNWDFALTDSGGGLALAPASAFPGLESRARIAVLANRDFESVTTAPGDTATYSVDLVPIRMGDVYVVRSRRSGCGVSTGYRYAKLSAVEIDVPRGVLRFEIVRNPYCDNRSFVPPEN